MEKDDLVITALHELCVALQHRSPRLAKLVEFIQEEYADEIHDGRAEIDEALNPKSNLTDPGPGTSREPSKPSDNED